MFKKNDAEQKLHCIDWSSEPDLEQLRIAYLLLQEDVDQAIIRLENLADRGSVMSMVYLGHVFYGGELVAKNFETAEIWYQQAAASGSIFAHYQLGQIYLEVNRYVDALRMLSIASDKGCASAAYMQGKIYWLGLGGKRDSYIAERCLERAVELGSIPASKFLGRVLIGKRERAVESLRGLRLICSAFIKQIVFAAIEGKQSDKLK